jgi:penicillin-binding protein 1A
MAKSNKRRILRQMMMFLAIVSVLIFIGMAILAAWKVKVLSRDLPTTDALTKKQPTMSLVFDRNGLKIGEVGLVKHEHLAAAEIPDLVVAAVVAAEDQRFFSHHGIDWIGIARAFKTALVARRFKQGGSTITQQVAKNYLLTRDKTLDRKIKEAVIARRIEEKFSKKEILELYLNKVNYGYGRYGIATAAKFYFGRSIKECSLAEVALLVGIHPSPARYNPRRNIALAKSRQKYVLDRMLVSGAIKKSEYEAAINAELTIVSDRATEAVTAQEVVDEVSKWLKTLFHDNDEVISQLGWKIYTTIDIKLQAAAKESLVAAAGHFRSEGAAILMNPEREIIAMVGGAKYAPGGMNRALYAKRQPGSTFKAFVYAAGFDADPPRFGTDDAFLNTVIAYDDRGKTWLPDNYRGEGSDQPFVTVKDAFAHSLNTVAVKAICGLGVNADVPEPVSLDYCRKNGLVKETMELAEKVGIKWSSKEKAEKNPSLALGSHDVTPVELLGAYMALIYDGRFVKPTFILKVEGNDAPEIKIRGTTTAVKNNTVAQMKTLARAVIEEGTGRKANGKFPETVYGKTGTTNDSTNAWFVGGTNKYWAVAWLGHKNQRQSLGREATGASAALPVWLDIMSVAYGKEGTSSQRLKKTAFKKEAESLPATDEIPFPEETVDLPESDAVNTDEVETVGAEEAPEVTEEIPAELFGLY